MLEFLNQLDTDVFLILNGQHSEFFDIWMLRITNKIFWTPLYLLLILLMIKTFKWESIWIILGAILVISMTDLIISGIMKPFFERLRPSRDPELKSLVHIVDGYRGGKYGFASGHAGTSFGLATYLWLHTRKYHSWIWAIFIWSLLFSYTRIYLGVHYPGDILVGAIIGTLIAFLVYKAYQWIFMLKSKRKAPE